MDHPRYVAEMNPQLSTVTDCCFDVMDTQDHPRRVVCIARTKDAKMIVAALNAGAEPVADKPAPPLLTGSSERDAGRITGSYLWLR